MGKQKKKEKKKETEESSFELDTDFPSLSCTDDGGDNFDSSSCGGISMKKSRIGAPPPSALEEAAEKKQPLSLMSPSVWTKTPLISEIHKEVAVDTSNSQLHPHQSSHSEWIVNATKSAKLPLKVEKRRHKTVTVVRYVSGDASALLTSLKLALGTGGKIIDSEHGAGGNASDFMEIEIQGDHLKRVACFLCEEHSQGVRTGGRGVLKGVSKSELALYTSTAKAHKVSSGGCGRSITKLDEKAAALKQKAGQSKKK